MENNPFKKAKFLRIVINLIGILSILSFILGMALYICNQILSGLILLVMCFIFLFIFLLFYRFIHNEYRLYLLVNYSYSHDNFISKLILFDVFEKIENEDIDIVSYIVKDECYVCLTKILDKNSKLCMKFHKDGYCYFKGSSEITPKDIIQFEYDCISYPQITKENMLDELMEIIQNSLQALENENGNSNN